MNRRQLFTLTLLATLTLSLISAGAFTTLPNTEQPEDLSKINHKQTKCTQHTATNQLTNNPPQATITTLSGMPNESFNPFAQNVNYTLTYKISITLPDNKTTGTITLPDNTTFTSTTHLKNRTNRTANKQHRKTILKIKLRY